MSHNQTRVRYSSHSESVASSPSRSGDIEPSDQGKHALRIHDTIVARSDLHPHRNTTRYHGQ
ncbi:hypothetical protein AMTR_s00133p00108460 [Amborella trichopoda]|uniref:Uncharacterized protein n=1 Tax=Amborella trichopoda TaxID=13333 RepID=W1PA06_AMBTC|nr:hypothetical protein AMTR_s00133p00108460 [Amborella trichopoda]